MTLDAFVRLHLPALEANEAKHNLILTLIAQAAKRQGPGLRTWSLGPAGACAVLNPGWPLVLGDLKATDCRQLAQELQGADYPGFLGPEEAAQALAKALEDLGQRFHAPAGQQIYLLGEAPRFPACQGEACPSTAADEGLIAAWLLAFHDEAVPEDPRPDPASLTRGVDSGQVLLWSVEGVPVAMAKVARRTKTTAVINGVYTPPGQRCRGYGGAVTAALARRIFAEGKPTACLHADLANPASNRCYQKIGFQPVARFGHHRVSD